MQEKINNIVNNEKLSNVLFNLYCRWQDERDYEDIEEYGKVIGSVMEKEFPTYGIKVTKASKRPFGVKIEMGGYNFHIFLKFRGNYMSVCAKKL